MKEFSFINQLLKPIAGQNSASLADDCAFFDGYCITKDVLVAGVHFFPSDAPFNLARKALRVNLSDLASSGALPFGFMLGLSLPKGLQQEWLEQFTQGLKADIEEFKFQLLGGDTVKTDGALTISVTAIGRCEKPVQRRGAKPGDNIFVSGFIGDGLLGLHAKRAGAVSGAFVDKYELPKPRIDLVPAIREHATSCIDISDGLLADLGHICQESEVGAEIFSDKIPLSPQAKAEVEKGTVKLMDLITGGDDYELLFTSPLASVPGCTKIGQIVEHAAIKLDGQEVKPKGYEHF